MYEHVCMCVCVCMYMSVLSACLCVYMYVVSVFCTIGLMDPRVYCEEMIHGNHILFSSQTKYYMHVKDNASLLVQEKVHFRMYNSKLISTS